MSINAEIITVTDAPTLIATGTSDGSIVLLRGATADIFLGGADVTEADGWPLTDADVLSITLIQGDGLYAITATTADVNVLQTRANT